MEAIRAMRGILHGVIMGACLWAVILIAAFGVAVARADVYVPPAKDRSVDTAPMAEAEASASASAYPTATASSSPSQTLSIDETTLALSAGGAGSQFYTGPCVVPKPGGWLKRGHGFLFYRADQAVEVDQACVAHAREMEKIAADQEQQRIELERQRLANDRLLLEIRLRELDSK